MTHEAEPDEYTLRAIAALGIALRDDAVPEYLAPKVEGAIETFVEDVKSNSALPSAEEEAPPA